MFLAKSAAIDEFLEGGQAPTVEALHLAVPRLTLDDGSPCPGCCSFPGLKYVNDTPFAVLLLKLLQTASKAKDPGREFQNLANTGTQRAQYCLSRG